MNNKTQKPRRDFILNMARGVSITAIGGFVWSAFISEATAAKLTLRPPGALKEKEFIKNCIKCGLCVEACPYDTLSLATPGDNIALGTPFFIPREMPCYMCPDIPCVPVCPTSALDESRVSKEHNVLDITMADMGLALIDEKNCIAFWGIQCDACYRACPILGQAITVEYDKNERTGKHAFLKPVVHADYCTGCGMCERACITQEASIKVFPKEIVQGKAGSHYIKSWESEDEKRLYEAQEIKTKTELSSQDARAKLNGNLLEDLYE